MRTHPFISALKPFFKYMLVHFGSLLGPYLQEAPVIIDKPDIVYVMENQSVAITVTLNHVNAAVLWKRYQCLFCQVSTIIYYFTFILHVCNFPVIFLSTINNLYLKCDLNIINQIQIVKGFNPYTHRCCCICRCPQSLGLT